MPRGRTITSGGIRNRRPFPAQSLTTGINVAVLAGAARLANSDEDSRAFDRPAGRLPIDGTGRQRGVKSIARVAPAGVAGLIVLVSCGPSDPIASPRGVWTDGSFDDWDGVAPLVVDRSGDVPDGSPVDLGAIAVQDDPRFLHFLIDLGDTVTVQGLLGSVELVLNVDGDSATGGAHGGVDGADMAVVLTRQSDPAADARGAGVGMRRIGQGGPGAVEPAGSVGLMVSPTHSSDRFEVRLNRSLIAGGPGQLPAVDQGGAVAGRLRYLRAGAVVDESPLFTHRLMTAAGEPPPLLDADAVARSPGAFRVVAWNVSDSSFHTNADAFQRILGALQPDVLLLDEIYFSVTLEELAVFGEGIGLGEEAWTWSLAQGGGRQRTAVGARGLSLRGEPAMARIDHAPGALELWLQEAGDEPEAPRMPPPAALARNEARGGLSATGAWVTVGGVDVLFVPFDLQSAGYDGSPRDRLRELQARTLNRAVATAVEERQAAGVVVAGDLNLVGSARPLAALRRGLGLGGSDLEVVRLERLRDRSLATWRGIWREDPFSPGRLDYVLYRDGVIQVVSGFAFDAADMSPVARNALEILETDTEQSDHLPLVVDYRVR